MDYTRNIKNQKIKTQIRDFFKRLAFATYRLGISGKFILICTAFLLSSLFFPWLIFQDALSNKETFHGAFSLYLGGLGYGMILGLFFVLFFLLSHEKKEIFRSYVPFRLSDAQAIVFIGAILATTIISFSVASFAYTHISSQTVIPAFGMKLALTSVFLLFIGAYFFSQSEKAKAVTFGYLEKREHTPLDEYRNILTHTDDSGQKKKEKNMSLPI